MPSRAPDRQGHGGGIRTEPDTVSRTPPGWLWIPIGIPVPASLTRVFLMLMPDGFGLVYCLAGLSQMII